MPTDSDRTASDYELKLDEQVEKYIETKQKLTYFLISASVAVTAYVLNFVVDNRCEIRFLLVFVISSCLMGLTTVGACLLTLHLEHRSFRLHLKYRHQRKLWKDLTADQQASWDRVNSSAAFTLWSTFVLLFFQIALASIFFTLFLISESLCTTLAKTQ